ncbi:MAG: hypothetical protein RR327_02570 [Clostridia bacterium]
MGNSIVKLSNKERILIAIGIMNTAAIAFGGYFIAKWTVSLTGGASTLLLQFCMQILPCFIAYFLTLKVLHIFKTSSMYAFSFVIQIIAYIIFFVVAKMGYPLQANIAFGLIAGVGNGVFWSCNNNFSVGFTSAQTRVKYISYSGMGNMLMTMLSNILIIVLMVIFGGEIDIPDIVYTMFFGSTLLFYVVAIVFSIKMDLSKYPTKFSVSMIKGYKEPRWKKFLWLNALYGMNNQIPDAILGVTLIAFTVFSNYFYLAMVVLSIGIKALSNYVLKTKVVSRHRFPIYVVCVCLAAANLLALTLTYTSEIGGYVALFVLIANSLVLTLRTQTEAVVHYQSIAEFANNDVELSGRFLSREIAITIGRIITAVVMLVTGYFFKENISIVLVVIFGYTLASALTIYATNKHFKSILEVKNH